ncbi:MAG: ABC transporter permease, partial [Ruminiclostridium sp.]|nr:ABC transporter permease [Ruminiclostridium sp.]
MKVGNKKCIFNLSLKNMKASKMRNIISVFAVALTTILFTAFFTIFMTIIDSTQFSNFRMVGTMAHGEFKRLTYEQYMELKDDPDIKEHGLRRFIGAVVNDNFDKNYAEVSYMSENTAKWSFINIKEGSLPKENTNQASVDDNVLSALGIEKKIGEEFTVEIEVDGKLTEETFTLCGWWEYDSVAPANHILISESKLDEIYTKLDTQCDDEMTGRYSLDVMFKNSRNIEEKHIKILERHGYVNDRNADNGIAIGINWGYLTENENVKPDAEMTVMIVTFLLLIISTGYLVIFNIFRTSVANDIRYYGMLKTIGTTGKQIRSILRFQALLLSGIGIPFGLFFGWFVGSVLTPVVMNEINVYSNGTSLNPVIF